VRTDDLDYPLPADLIAQTPAEPRDSARLLGYRRRDQAISDGVFRDLPDRLERSDVVVVNTTRVLPVRLRAAKPTGGSVEILLLEPGACGEFTALARPARRLAAGMLLRVSDQLAVRVVDTREGGEVRVTLEAAAPWQDAVIRAGQVPLPPYIHQPLADPARYQTVYADTDGSAAAPTAGLHFTPQLLAAVAARATLVRVELRIGLDTFRPVSTPTLAEHPMHSEAYRVTSETRTLLRDAHRDGRRIVAVGTTSVRVLETIADDAAPDEGRTRLLIQPGYRFRMTGALVTNFHLPRSTLLAMVMAMIGVDETRRVYAEAVARRYRFYSFGDAMLIE
jgi:S-adenosylmethionine:tRNA ribosyltransferase-isomerase